MNLPTEIHLLIFDRLDPVDSTCLGLTSQKLYAIHRHIHGTVSLSSKHLVTNVEVQLHEVLEQWVNKQSPDGWPDGQQPLFFSRFFSREIDKFASLERVLQLIQKTRDERQEKLDQIEKRLIEICPHSCRVFFRPNCDHS